MALQHLRSGVANKRPIPTIMSEGQIALNTNEASPGLFFKDSNGDLVKIGPVHIGTSAPNSSPASTAATALVTGATYQILTVGTSDFTAVGASANTVGTVFTATGTTTGTGTVSGQQGVEKGEQWLDTTGGNYVLKIYDGTAWRSEAGEFVNVSGDTMTGALLLDNAASVSAPDLSFDGDANTGIYSPGADQFGVATGGTAALTIDASQRVGVGTTSPDYKLTLLGSDTDLLRLKRSGAGGGAKIRIENGDSNYYDIFNDGAENLTFSYNSQERMRIDSSGRVAIGSNTAMTDAQLTLAADSEVGLGFARTGAGRFDAGILVQSGHIYFKGGADSGTLAGLNHLMVIQSGGNVGIGTTSPSAELHVATSADNGGLVLHKTSIAGSTGAKLSYQLTNTGSSAVEIASIKSDQVNATAGNETGNLLFSTTNSGSASEKMRIDSSGRVGIGSTPNSNEQFLVHGGGNSIYVPFARSSTKWITIHSGGTDHAIFCDTGGDIRFGHGNSRNAIDTEAARIDSSGRLLVGTSSSRGVGSGTQAGFQVETDASQIVGSFVVNYPSTTGAIISLAKSRSNSVGGSGLVQNDDDLGLIRFIGADGTDLQTVAASIGCQVDGTPGSNDMPGRLVFSTTVDGGSSPTERMRINSGGTLTAFAGTIHQFKTARTSGSDEFIRFMNGATTIDNGTTRCRIRADGDLENTNNSYTGLSDQKLKENIVEANSQWSDIKALQVRNYNFKQETNYGTHTQIGLIAQEVETVSPGLVKEMNDVDAEGNDLGTTTKSVNYSVLYMKAVKALQEAMARIETLEAKVAALEAS